LVNLKYFAIMKEMITIVTEMPHYGYRIFDY
jgi:hypothetical protein